MNTTRINDKIIVIKYEKGAPNEKMFSFNISVYFGADCMWKSDEKAALEKDVKKLEKDNKSLKEQKEKLQKQHDKLKDKSKDLEKEINADT